MSRSEWKCVRLPELVETMVFYVLLVITRTFMPATCLNCGAEIQHQFCPYCGQKKEVEKLNWHSLVHEIAHFFTHIERGFLTTSFQLLIRPGRVINEYLAGKRIKYHKPISFYLIWAAIRLITFTAVIGLMHYENLRSGNSFVGTKEEGMYVVHHNQVFGLLTIPIQSFFIWLIIARPRLNYIETLAASIYASAVIEMLIFIQIFIVGLLLRINFLKNSFVIQVEVVYSCWAFFFLMDVFKKDKIKLLPLRVLLAMVISFLVFQKLSAWIAGYILAH